MYSRGREVCSHQSLKKITVRFLKRFQEMEALPKAAYRAIRIKLNSRFCHFRYVLIAKSDKIVILYHGSSCHTVNISSCHLYFFYTHSPKFSMLIQFFRRKKLTMQLFSVQYSSSMFYYSTIDVGMPIAKTRHPGDTNMSPFVILISKMKRPSISHASSSIYLILNSRHCL